jgi:voltage-gated potassium channel
VQTGITLRHFERAMVAFVAAWLAGALAFAVVDQEGALEAVYRSTVTISLTGLDVRPDDAASQVVTILLIFTGMAIYAYIAGALVEIVARGVLTGAWGDRKRQKMIDSLDDHYIICGYGRVGQAVADEFRTAGVRYVVLDFHPDVAVAASAATPG